MKYAFTDTDQGTLFISVVKNKHTVTLIIQDNGKGFSLGETPNNPQGFGLKLIGILVKNIHGDLIFEYDRGTKCIIHFDL